MHASNGRIYLTEIIDKVVLQKVNSRTNPSTHL